MLVGKDGEVLEALQELARLAVMTETGHRSRLMLDVAGHRDKRRKVLQELAKDAVAEVKDTGEPVRLAPMNPFERKIVHDVGGRRRPGQRVRGRGAAAAASWCCPRPEPVGRTPRRRSLRSRR